MLIIIKTYSLCQYLLAHVLVFPLLVGSMILCCFPLTKIEELGAGNVYCQLLDAAYGQRVSLAWIEMGGQTWSRFSS